MPDIARWSDLKNYSTRWHSRSQIAGSYLKDCQSVLDIGAGNQSLSSYVKGKYYPVDCVQIYPDTIILDLDTDFDVSTLPISDGVALIGVLEHVNDPLETFAKLSKLGHTWAISYMDKEKHPHINLISLKRLQMAFKEHEFNIVDKELWRNQMIYKLERV